MNRNRNLNRGQRENPMWYGNTKSLLESIVRGLRTEAPQNDAEWKAQTDLVQACLAEMAELSEPTVNPSVGGLVPICSPSSCGQAESSDAACSIHVDGHAGPRPWHRPGAR